jgi:hypothetical protein
MESGVYLSLRLQEGKKVLLKIKHCITVSVEKSEIGKSLGGQK